MKQNKIKLGYQKPQTEIMSINSESFLLDDSLIPGQHNPGRRRTGPSASNAKEEVEWLEGWWRDYRQVMDILHCGRLIKREF